MSRIHESSYKRSRSALRFVAVEDDAGDPSDGLQADRHERSIFRSVGYGDEDPSQPFFTIFFVAGGFKSIKHQPVMGISPLKYQ